MAASTRTIPSLLVAGVVLGLLGVGTWIGVRVGGGREEAPTPVPASAEEDAASAGLAGAGRREGAPPTVAATPAAAVIARGSARVTGEVRLAADGRPAAGTVVRAVRDGEEVARATVGAAGTFALTGLAADGSTTVEASREGHATARRAGLALVDGATRDVGTLWLDAAIRVEVRVVGAAGAPVRDAKVRAFRTRTAVAPEDWAGRADEAVAERTTGADGVARFDDLAADAWTFRAEAAGLCAGGAGLVTTRRGGAAFAVTIALEAGFPLTGLVRSSSGSPCPGFRCSCSRRGRPSRPWNPRPSRRWSWRR